MNINEETIKNDKFRKIVWTGKYAQVVLMSLKPGGEIGEEIHKKTDQFFRVEAGKGTVMVENKTFKVKNDDAFIIYAGQKHNVINSSKKKDLKLYTVYSGKILH